MGDEFPEGDAALPANLRFLRILVTVLTAVMIFGVITIVALLVIRLNGDARPILVHPELFSIPEGVGTVGYALHDGLVIIVGDDGIIRVFEVANQTQVQEFQLAQ
jgi:hypothetical protein